MVVPDPYLVPILLLIVGGGCFVCLFLLHICKNHGLYNSHKPIQDRRQRFQKIEYNLKTQQIFISSPKEAFIPTRPIATQIPPKAVLPKPCVQTSLAVIHAVPEEPE